MMAASHLSTSSPKTLFRWMKYTAIWAMFIYFGFAWLIFHDRYLVDFSSLYSSINAIWQDINPYQVLTTDYLPIVQKLPANLNPPIVLFTFMPLHFLSYHTAMLVWFGMLMLCTIGNFYLAMRYFCSISFSERYWYSFLVIYLTLFSTIVGLAIAQLGAFIAFWLMLGYHYYRQKKWRFSAACWGYITACKFFPAVILLFCLQQRQFRLALMYAFFSLGFALLPGLFWGTEIYSNYTDMMSRVMWYGDSWNASFFGIVGRLWIDTNNIHIDLWPYQVIWAIVAAPVLIFYLCQTTLSRQFSFCIALVLMLLLSPFGWLYYFAMLLPVLIYTAERAEISGRLWLWFIALVLMNLPVDYITEKAQGLIFARLTLYSVHFYGLVCLMILLLLPGQTPGSHTLSCYRLPIILNQILTLGICVLIIVYHALYFG